MFKEYWNGYVAIGIVVGISIAFNIVGFLSVGFDWVGLEKARTDTNTYAEQQCSRQQAEHAATSSTIFNSQEADSDGSEADQRDGSKHEEPDWCDLAAQQSMADSTFGMEQTAWIALGLTALGVGLVWRTLYYTRETLGEARDATKVAMNSLRATERFGQLQLRAWLSAPEHKIIVGATQDQRVSHIGFQLVGKNTGPTPAYKARLLTAIAIDNIPALPPDDSTNQVAIAPGAEYFTAPYYYPVAQIFATHPINEDSWVYIVFRAEYYDLFSEDTRVTTKVFKIKFIGTMDITACRAQEVSSKHFSGFDLESEMT